MATIRLNRRGSSIWDIEQRDLDVDCAELSQLEDSSRSERSLLITRRAEEEEGKLASKRQAAIDARMGSVRGALVLRLEESSVLIPESLLTAAHLVASTANTAGSVCYWAGLYSPGSALFNVGCSLASVVTACDLARVSHERFESQFIVVDRFQAESSLASTRKRNIIRQEQENAMLALRMFIVAPLCYDVGVLAYYDEVILPDSILFVASLLFVAGSYALIVGYPSYSPTLANSIRNPNPNSMYSLTSDLDRLTLTLGACLTR